MCLSGFERLLKGHGADIEDILYRIDLFTQFCGRRINQLGTVGTIDLDAVVFRWIMACSDHDAEVRPVLPDMEGEFGSRDVFLRKADGYIILYEDTCHRLRKFRREMPCVVADDDERVLHTFQIVCDAESNLFNCIAVQAVGPETDLAPDACSSE